MEGNSEVTSRKRKRVSKNKKKNWRKTDIQDVEDHLDDQRLQERTGGLVTEKTDEQLFFVDTVAEDDKKQPDLKTRRGQKSLKCQALLEPDANIKPARVKHNVRGDGVDKRCSAVQERLTQRQLTATQLRARKQSQSILQVRQKELKKNTKLPVVQTDLWADKPQDEEVDEFYLKQTKRKRKLPPSHYHEKTSNTPSIELPHPGSSYNPTFDDHQDLLSKALDVELQKEKEELKIKRAIDDKIEKKTWDQVHKEWMNEMSAGINQKDDDNDDGDERDDDNDRLSVNPPVRREDKKTERQRRKEKDRKQKKQLVKQEKVSTLRKREVFQLKSIKRGVLSREAAVKEQQRRKASKREEKNNQPRKLGKLKYVEPDLEIKLSDELVGSLRHLKPEGHLMLDRYKSLQKRNVIEARQKAKSKRRYKQKSYTKKSHRGIV